MYGTNDSFVDQNEQAPRVSKEQYANNLRRMVARLRAAQVLPVLMTPPRWAKGARNGAGADPNVALSEYVEICRQLSREEKVPLVDHFQIWSEAEKQGVDLAGWTTDLCHPNPLGQRKLAEALLPVALEAWNAARGGPK
jgi:lysophospholipase L1-like esterase